MPRILIVDDEPDLCEILQFNLDLAGYQTEIAASAEEALTLLQPDHDLILLDIMLGGMSGWDLARTLRKERNLNIPILFLTAKTTEADLLKSFSVGGDDFITKPFSLPEVLARIRACLRRTAAPQAPMPSTSQLITLDGLQLDPDRGVAMINGARLNLSPKEWGILALLLSRPGCVFSREDILHQVWHGESCVLDRTVDVHIARLRRKLGPMGARLINRQGHGYCLE